MKSVLSLFSGIGGLCHHGISAAGLSHKFRVQQFVEISPYSQSQLCHEQPEIPIQPDITNYHCHKGQFDILCGGFPCSGNLRAACRRQTLRELGNRGSVSLAAIVFLDSWFHCG